MVVVEDSENTVDNLIDKNIMWWNTQKTRVLFNPIVIANILRSLSVQEKMNSS